MFSPSLVEQILVPEMGELEDMTISVRFVGVSSSGSKAMVCCLPLPRPVASLIYATAEFPITLRRDKGDIR